MNRSYRNSDFRQALIREAPYLRRFARSLVGDMASADDLVQDTFERAISRAHLFDHNRELRPWLFRILRNLNISQYRQSRSRGVQVPLDEASETTATQNTPHDGNLAVRDISRALTLLPYDQREVLVLIALEGLKYREVMDVLDIPIGTVMSRLSRARERLRELLEITEHKTLRQVK